VSPVQKGIFLNSKEMPVIQRGVSQIQKGTFLNSKEIPVIQRGVSPYLK